jgi:hypothetical protein
MHLIESDALDEAACTKIRKTWKKTKHKARNKGAFLDHRHLTLRLTVMELLNHSGICKEINLPT